MGKGKIASGITKYGGKARDKVNFPGLDSETEGAVPVAAGATQTAKGIFTGNGRDIKEGLKEQAHGAWNIASAAPARSAIKDYFKGPQHEHLGGSADALAGLRDKYAQGQEQGRGYTQSGIGLSGAGASMLGNAYDQASADKLAASAYSGQGQGIGAGGLLGQQGAINSQNKVIGSMLDTAAQVGPSAAQAQLQMGLDRTQRGMMAQAASARGGNQAAAMSGAQATGAQMALDVNQQAAVLRANEIAQQRAQLIQAQQNAAGSYAGQQGVLGNTAQLGYGMQGQGLGLGQQSTGQLGSIGVGVGQIGLGQANVGLGQQNTYVGAENSLNKAQLETDVAHEAARQEHKEGIMGQVGGIAAKMFGG